MKNAFNSAGWDAIAHALHRFKVPVQLCKLLESYFDGRIQLYDTEEGRKSVRVIPGVPQGSILGPMLLNAMYDDVLKLLLPTGVKIVGFTNDITLVVYDESMEEVELTAAHSISIVEEWMKSRKLGLAHHNMRRWWLRQDNLHRLQHKRCTD